MASKYKVLGEEGSSLEIDGVSHAAGAEVELEEEVAAPFVADGKLEAVSTDAGTDNGEGTATA